MLHLLTLRFLSPRRLLHLFIQLIHITQHLPLLIAKSFQLSLNLFPLLIRSGRTKLRLQLLQPFVDHLLTSRKLFQTIQNLQLLTLLLIALLLLLSLSFGFVAIACIVQFQLLQLLLRGTVATTAAASLLLLLLLLTHLGFSRSHPQQRLNHLLLQRHRIRKPHSRARIFHGGQLFNHKVHFRLGPFRQRRCFLTTRRFLLRLLQLLNGLSL